MAAVDLKSLIGRLDGVCKRTLESAAGLCLSRTHYNVEIEHWLTRLLETPDTDLDALLRHFEVDRERLMRDLARSLDRLKTGNSRAPSLSPSVVDLAKEAWLIASIDFGANRTRSGHLLVALLSVDALARQAREASSEFAALSGDSVRQVLPTVTADSAESQQAVPAEAEAGAGPGRPAGPTSTPSLDQFTIDLTERARAGAIDPVLGRESEIRQVIDILTRRRQNNPILTGEPGVGKTAVAEGFALRVVSGDVPPALRQVAIRTLDLSLLQAGAGVKGEFENRLKGVIDEVKASPKPIILFIDEAHTLIGAGGQAGQGDAANLLKPALARGELRTIAATTWAEYKKYFERDAALARRFQVVKVDEPSQDVALQIMRGLAKVLEAHHGVRILDEALDASVRLSSRFLPGRQLPDKSVSILDTACARVALSQGATPAAIEDTERRIEQIETALRIIRREDAATGHHVEHIAELEEEKVRVEGELEQLRARWSEEQELVGSIRAVRERLEAEFAPAQKKAQGAAPGKAQEGAEEAPAAPVALTNEERASAREELAKLGATLDTLQGETPLVRAHVDGQAVAEIISNWTGIPAGRMVADQIHAVLTMREQLEQRVIGQSHALEALSQSVRTSRADLGDPQKPIGVFMLAGTSGVGKTETAIALADLLYGGEQNMTVINMSEFKEEHKVSLLMGSPPGYVGYGEGGVLTEAVRRKPYSVVLLDELEKAHPGVQEIFYQVFDKGTMKDGEGRDIDFRNCVIMMTTNVGTDTITSLAADPETMPDAEGLTEALQPELLAAFKPAFLGRVTVLPYLPLGDEVLAGIAELKIGKIRRRVAENYGAELTYDPELIRCVVDRCKEVETGARNIDHLMSRTLLPEMATEFLAHLARGETIEAVHVAVDESGAFRYTLTSR